MSKHRRHTPPLARLKAREVREQEKLPHDGRESEHPLSRLEEVLCDTFAPDAPTYDVGSIQGVDFHEWTYTEGLGCLMVFTQSVEINARLMQLAVEYDGGGYAADGPAGRIASTLGDKWANIQPRDGVYTAELAVRAAPPVALQATDEQPERIPDLWTFFPPGDNLKDLINVDNVLRAFDADSRWMMKPHPITTAANVAGMRRAFGASRIYSRRASGMEILRDSAVVGFTTSSEMGLMALLLGRTVEDFTLYEFEARGRYHALYKALRGSPVIPHSGISRILQCPWSGVVPLDTAEDEAADRLAQYKARTLELRDQYLPLVRIPRHGRRA